MRAGMLSARGNNAQSGVAKGEKIFLNMRAASCYLICVETQIWFHKCGLFSVKKKKKRQKEDNWHKTEVLLTQSL